LGYPAGGPFHARFIPETEEKNDEDGQTDLNLQ